MAEKHDYVQRIAISDLFISDNKAWVIDSFNSLYIDDDHLSYSGSLKAKDRIISALKESLKSNHIHNVMKK